MSLVFGLTVSVAGQRFREEDLNACVRVLVCVV